MEHTCVSALCHLSETFVLRWVNIRRKIACLQSAVGPVRWKTSCSPAPFLTAMPTRALIDEPITLEGHHLPPHSPITVRAYMHNEDGDLWEALSHYNTDWRGVVNMTTDVSVGGSYVGCEPMGLFWALQPAPGEREGLRLRKRNVETPYSVQLSLLEGHIPVLPSEGSNKEQLQRGEQELAAVTVERWYMAPGVRRIEIRQNGVVGTLFLPPGKNTAFQFLQDHPQVCGDRLGVIGLSFGAYLALRIATQIGVNPRCVIGVNGPIGSINKLSDSDGKTESFDGDQKHWSYDEQGYVSFREVSTPNNIPPENKAKVENLCCPLLYIVSEDDLSCAAIENADEIEKMLVDPTCSPACHTWVLAT
ncbi:acyl-coenzyme A thioesterase 2, mitochondrial-like [Salvelinus fontinalis]|uniref:acyl-coenzyme A thioesterase 2, mitochondrial-like n=1 Tax=Salvelinus fontinalis TaxID=8038 RepID=UPI002486B926|nr:acyl-coenzyme A thioesterase 2, mitochondrial-like [Salvelinus fontinalis]